jgi:ABC-2 type transport system permease protein
MVWKIARKEFREAVRDKRFLVSALIVGGLLLASLALGFKHNVEREREHRAAQDATERQWLDQGEKSPHGAAHYGVYAFKPQMPLAFVDRGIESFTGSAVWLEAHKQNDFRYRPAQDQTSLTRFGELTAALVLQILLPLLIVLLTFNAFAGERESGTLRQVLSLGIRPPQLAFGKILGLTALLALLLIPAAVIGSIALSAADWDADFSLSRLILMSAGYLLYLGVFVAVSLAVSARAASSRFALLALLGFWIVSCLILPRAATDIVRRVYPTPSAMEFASRIESDIKNGADSHNPADRRLAELKIETMRKYGVQKLEDLPVNFDGIALQAGEDYGNQVFDRHYGDLWNRFAEQDSLRQATAIFAPVLAVSSVSRGLAGTDFAQQRDFAAAAENHRRLLIRTINDHVLREVRYGDSKYTIGRELWAQVPDFQYSAPAAANVLREQTTSIAVLLFWFVGSMLLLLQSVKKMKV